MAQQLTLDELKQAVSGHAAAFRCITEYQPMGGPGDKVFPPTYEGGKYATEKRIIPDTGEIVDCVLLDSVQSQANRMESALLDAWRTRNKEGKRRIELPVITAKFQFDDPEYKSFTVTSLEAPHRAADAIFRDSKLGDVTFRKSEKGRILDNADVRNAAGLFGLCPTALVFGIWDSTGPRGGLGTKFQRALVSEIVGWGVMDGVNTGSRVDPLGIVRASGPIFRTEKGDWTTNEELAQKIKDGKDEKSALYGLSKGKLVSYDKEKNQDQGAPSKINHGNVVPDFAYARDNNNNIIYDEVTGLSKGKLVSYDKEKNQDQGAPSKINHGNVVPDFAYARDNNNNIIYDEVTLENGKIVRKARIKGGFSIAKAVQTTVLSLACIRRLRFPLNGSTDSDQGVDLAARCVLTALGLAAAVLSREGGADLRSRCQLFAQQEFIWELLDVPGQPPKTYVLDGDSAVKLFNDAIEEAKALCLPWEDEISVVPSEDLFALVKKSQELNMHQVEGDD
ncbi:type I-G CRISPR-associated RAMP protein Csb1/Cas7g [Methylomicrobium sp. RS1]|uniref:type I-G CRISPR-associated RAMP protein Csb1/Cas7g n=1 Tax=Candidatus Methylomicrobium oryzae TaxID=2802053 RepID=UPI001920E988|nr:type I-U CRISPR-associated RAMP protein Csb1/Cas7u [Methylomicrobium sp. RS1]MBL1263961.1 type I-U CRISPR-associated protein Cas7 [Methylomicrobium sp. RS1]